MTKVKKQLVCLKVKGTDTKQDFEIKQALSILTLRNSAWELSDSKFEFNGSELINK